jgi:hypothetical protein
VKRSGSPAGTLLLGIAADLEQATQALADGADLVDASAATHQAHAAIRASAAGRALWAGTPADPVDADRLEGSQATAIAVAAISTWLGAPVIRTRHTLAVRRAIDMTASIAGRRPPALTIRGLA